MFKKMIDAAERYYIDNDQDAFSVGEVLPKRLDRLNCAVGITFAGSVLSSVLFVIINMNMDLSMNNREKAGEASKVSIPANTFSKVSESESEPSGSEQASEPATTNSSDGENSNSKE